VIVSVTEAGVIGYVGPEDDAPTLEREEINATGRLIVPGFIDIHVHGGNGIFFGALDKLEPDLEAYSAWVVESGVTGFLLTLAAPDLESLTTIIQSYVGLLERGEVEGAIPYGFHLEGPFLNPEKRGAFNPEWLREPTIKEAEALIANGGRWILQVTLAPELPGAEKLAKVFSDAGVVVAMGHTNADYDLAQAALSGYWTHVTHTFNAQRGFEHRSPGALGAVLTSKDVSAELIADMFHVHPAAMKILVNAIGVDQVVLITDAIPGAGLEDGSYHLVGHDIIVKNGKATLVDGTLAGSTVQLNHCVRNLYREVGVTLQQAIQMASHNPARAMRLSDQVGSIEAGVDANLCLIDDDVNVYLTMVQGRIVYDRLHSE
jgi:N-acetylglucosamine-6-phosphate deacetylase